MSMKNRFAPLFFTLSIVALCFAGCSDDAKGDAEEDILCIEIVDCPVKLYCNPASNTCETLEMVCLQDDDCPDYFRCINGECKSKRCNINSECLTGEFCDEQSDPSVCAPNAAVTDGDEPIAVDGDDDRTDTQEEEGSNAQDVCMIGLYRCRGDELQACAMVYGGYADWVFQTECENGCETTVEGGQCIGEEEKICTAGNRRCNQNAVELCNEEGVEWVVTDACEGGTCRYSDTDAWCGALEVCGAGMKKCNEAGNGVEECNEDGTAWELFRWCSAGQTCADGQCVGNMSCTPGFYRCDQAANAIQECKRDGTGWETTLPCGDTAVCSCDNWVEGECTQAYCKDNPVCDAWTYGCQGTSRALCTGMGWMPLEDCASNDPPQTCVDGQCI